MDRALNADSGLLGVSGVSANMRDVLTEAAAGNERARLARDMFVHRLVARIGGMVAVLNGLDAIVFTAGIGERSPEIRAATCASLRYLGVGLDEAANNAGSPDSNLARGGSPVQVLLIAAREDLAVLRQVRRILGWTTT